MNNFYYIANMITCEDMIKIALRSGCIVLENGGETYRTEETIVHVAKALGAKTASAFVTPTVIMFSYTDDDDHYHSAIRRVTKSSVNLQKVSQISNLARRLEKRQFTSDLKQVEALLDRIEKAPVNSNWLVCFGAALNSFCFAFMLGGHFLEAVFSFVIGLILRIALLGISHFPLGSFVTSMFSGGFIAIFAWLVGTIGKNVGFDVSSFVVMIATLMQVVPGLAIVNGIRDIISGDLVSGTARIMDAFMIAAGLSTGAVTIFMIMSKLIG